MASMLPSTNAQSVYCGGFQPATQRPYVPAAGTIVSTIDGDTVQLQPRGWLLLPSYGTTAQRPATNNLNAGTLYVDTTLSITVIWDGGNWRNVTSGAIA